MSESDDETRARKQRMQDRMKRADQRKAAGESDTRGQRNQEWSERQEALDARRNPAVLPNKGRKKRVAVASATLAGIGFVLLLAVLLIQPETNTSYSVLVAASQLWALLVGAAAIGWIVHEALPDD